MAKYRYIYGPVASWRLGKSLGIDPLSDREKICTFNCVYCQLGKTGIFTDNRKEYVSTKGLIEELTPLPCSEIDYITFSGRGEPTLAKNLGEMIKEIKKFRKEKIAVITNSSLLHRKDVQRDLMLADFVLAKLDASSESQFAKINKPIGWVRFDKMIEGLKEFRANYRGRFALQIMFIEDNKGYASGLAEIAKEISPDELQINTPLRPNERKPLSKEEIKDISRYFSGIKKIISVYDIGKKGVLPINKDDTLKRHGI